MPHPRSSGRCLGLQASRSAQEGEGRQLLLRFASRVAGVPRRFHLCCVSRLQPGSFERRRGFGFRKAGRFDCHLLGLCRRDGRDVRGAFLGSGLVLGFPGPTSFRHQCVINRRLRLELGHGLLPGLRGRRYAILKGRVFERSHGLSLMVCYKLSALPSMRRLSRIQAHQRLHCGSVAVTCCAQVWVSATRLPIDGQRHADGRRPTPIVLWHLDETVVGHQGTADRLLRPPPREIQRGVGAVRFDGVNLTAPPTGRLNSYPL